MMCGQSLTTKPLKYTDQFSLCEQCGRCASACPLTTSDGFNIRRLLRYVELGYEDDISKTTMPWTCATCGRCEDACPNDIPILVITRSLRQIGPNSRIPKCAPCISACPAHIDIPHYLRLISSGEIQKAFSLIMEKAPFPGVLGRICHHPCEDMCKRGEVNAPIAICSAKRWIADNTHTQEISEMIKAIPNNTGQSVAIIGAGPSGLTAAYFLRKSGHDVTVFEARAKPGGMLRYGIPEYRLPKAVLDKEIDLILSTGIDLKTGVAFGRDMDMTALKERSFHAIYLATGAQSSRKITIEGIELEGVLWGVDFLVEVQKALPFKVSEDVVVIGGGNVAIDVALTALRLGAKRVRLACLEEKEMMPASAWDIKMVEEEGIELLFSWGPKKIVGDGIKVTGVELIRCTSVFDTSGNFCPYFDETSKEISADQVILAIGQTSETDFCMDFCLLEDEGAVKVQNGCIEIDRLTHQTSQKGVFAGGDITNGPSSVVEAIADGRKAARSIDCYLKGVPMNADNESSTQYPTPLYDGKRTEGFADLPRIQPKNLSISQRRHNFDEIQGCLSKTQAIEESKRCLQCDCEISIIKNKT